MGEQSGASALEMVKLLLSIKDVEGAHRESHHQLVVGSGNPGSDADVSLKFADGDSFVHVGLSEVEAMVLRDELTNAIENDANSDHGHSV